MGVDLSPFFAGMSIGFALMACAFAARGQGTMGFWFCVMSAGAAMGSICF